ncbi:MAG: hypothetical protein M3133_00705 [Actinomycetota bacterium]|nr:hypothetical protein [Actinomycetota bacterium]
MKTETDLATPRDEFAVFDGDWDTAAAWFEEERRRGTVLAREVLWREAYAQYLARAGNGAGDAAEDPALLWPSLVSRLVFQGAGVPRNERAAAESAVAFLRANRGASLAEHARRLEAISEEAGVDRVQLLGLLGPGVAYPWMFPRSRWTPDVVGRGLEALVAPLPWPASPPDSDWFREAAERGATAFLSGLRERAQEGSDLDRMLAATASLVAAADAERKDIAVREAHAFIAALEHHGLSGGDIQRYWTRLSALRWAVVLVRSYETYAAAERYLATSRRVRDADPEAALRFVRRAVNLYKRLCVAQQYPERLLERHQEVHREMEELRRAHQLPDNRSDHMLLVSTFNSPADLQRLLLSIWQELTAFGFGRAVHVIVSDDSTEGMREQNRQLIADAARAGVSISHWDLERKNRFLDQLNAEVFPDGTCDVRDLAGPRKPGEKGIPYGRFRNFLRLVALKESRELGLRAPVSTWLDQDNEIGALVLTRSGTLAKRHVFNYFDQKSGLFERDDVLVGGGGYTNDALEGVEKFWVAWGVLHHAFDLAQQRSPEEPPILAPEVDITRFRPWDQSDTLERLPREGEEVETFADQILLLLSTLLGTFRGKYENQVEVYHPWTDGSVVPGDDLLVEQTRAFAGMPGGNTSFAQRVLASAIPFITVGGRGEDIFHLWQVESEYGVGTVHLTHTPALHTRNVSSGRSDLVGEIVDSYNGRILREPPYLWAALTELSLGEPSGEGAERERLGREAEERINNLRAEALSTIAAVSGFAAALEPYLDEKNDFWWLRRAAEDPRYREVIGSLRDTVAKYRSAERLQREAADKLLTVEDVNELTDEFIRAYPHWGTVVQRVGGLASAPTQASPVAPFPFKGYGSAGQGDIGASTTATATSRGYADEPLTAELTSDPPWREVVQAALLLFRKYEQGASTRDVFLRWDERVARLRAFFDHYAALAGDVPEFVWTLLYRDALLVPHSPPYVAVSQFLTDEFRSLEPSQQQERLTELADRLSVERALLEEALGMSAESAPARS